MELRTRSRGEGGGRRGRGLFDFPSSASKYLQTSPSQPWQALLHTHLPIITLLCTCRQMGAAAAHLSVSNWHIFNHPHVLYMTYTQAGCKLRTTDTQVGFPFTVPRVQGCPKIFTRDLGSLTVARFTKSFHQDVDYGLFGQTHTTTEPASMISGFPLLTSYPHLPYMCQAFV